MYRLSADQRVSVVSLLVEGNSLRSIERIAGVHRDTAMRLLIRVGSAAGRLLDDRMRNLQLLHVQADEIWTFVRKKQGRLTPDEKADDTIGDQFLFVALDEDTKLIPAFRIGKRNGANTDAFMLDLAGRLVVPGLGTDATADRTLISTDGWAAYPGAVDLAFADTVNYGVIIKDFRESEQPGRYGPPELVHTQRRPMTRGMDPWCIRTSHVERNNLTIRTFVKRFARLSLGFSKKLENLTAAVALHVAHYNFCRVHSTLRYTPAMAARVTGHIWETEELLVEAGVLD